jgi:hypothetical protein
MLNGKILRDGQTGPGLISSNGVQHEFTLEKNWRSDVAPKVGMSVNFTVNEDGSLDTVQAVDLQAEISERAKELGRKVQEGGLPAAQGFAINVKDKIASTVGIPRAVLFALILVVWYSFNIFSVQVTSNHASGLSFFGLLGVLNSQEGLLGISSWRKNSAGFYAVLAWIAALLIFLPAPLAFFLIILGAIKVQSSNAVSRTTDMMVGLGGKLGREMAEKMMSSISDAISLGFGFYATVVLVIIAAVLAVMDFRRG